MASSSSSSSLSLFLHSSRPTTTCRSRARQHARTPPRFSPSTNLSSVPERSSHHRLFSPAITGAPRCAVTARAALRFTAPIISPLDPWGTWTALFAAGAFGIWSEQNTKVGSALSGALVSTLVGLAGSSAGIIASQSPTYGVVLEFLLPMAVPLLLFNADLRRILRSTGTLLLAFLLGSVATTVGTVVAYLLVPMRSLGQDNWKIAAALMSRHIGGAANYVAVSDALGVSPSVLTAGLAADNVVCALYFTSLFSLATKIPAEASSSSDGLGDLEPSTGSKLPVSQSATAIAISFAICKAATYITKQLGIQGGTLPIVTAIAVVLATMFPNQFQTLAPAGQAIAVVLMQVFFTVVGANGSIWNVINTTPGIFAFAFVQIAVHLLVILGIGKLLGFEKRLLLLASNANVGGPTTACGMATSKGWNSLIVPGILAGVFGIAIATFLGIAFGVYVLQHM